MERDDAWLEQERQRLLTWPREKLIGWLQWNDGNGIWTDEDMIANDMDPMTVADAVEQVMEFVRENRETPEEMMGASLEANPSRYPKPAEFDPWLKGTGDLPNQPQRKGPDDLRMSYEELALLDPEAASALDEMLGSDADRVEITNVDGDYHVRDPQTNEEWDYDGAHGLWVPEG